MVLKETKNNTTLAVHAQKAKEAGRRTQKKGSRVTEERAKAQRTKLEKGAEVRQEQEEQEVVVHPAQNKKAGRQEALARRRVIETLIEAYIQDHIGGNHSEKTLEWHRTALGLMQLFFKEELAIAQIDEVEADDISAWFAHMRATPGARGKVRSERTVQTYARSARAFFHWLVRRETLEHNPFDHIVFPKVGRPLIQTITTEEFEKLLLACAPPNETGPFAERATVRNRAILWLLYDTGIRVSELINLCLDDLDRKKGVVTVLGKGSKERRIALGQNCLRNLSYYLDKHRILSIFRGSIAPGKNWWPLYTRGMLENFDPNAIEDETARKVVLYLMNLVENQHTTIQEQAEEIQRLRDEVNRLKGEQGKPKVRANKPVPNLSSEKERRESKPHHKESKQSKIKIDRVEVLKVDRQQLPQDAQFKG